MMKPTAAAHIQSCHVAPSSQSAAACSHRVPDTQPASTSRSWMATATNASNATPMITPDTTDFGPAAGTKTLPLWVSAVRASMTARSFLPAVFLSPVLLPAVLLSAVFSSFGAASGVVVLMTPPHRCR